MYLEINKNRTGFELPHNDLHREFRSEHDNEHICPYCDIEMSVKKKQRKNHYDKENTSYHCLICGFHHRKRTNNEILRDLGEKE